MTPNPTIRDSQSARAPQGAGGGLILLACLALAGCGKLGVGGHISHAFGNWAQVDLPNDCTVKQIAAEEGASGVVVLCADGRVFR